MIVTYPSPAEYEELLAVGRWAGIDDVVAAHLMDQISQAIGRNSGFRKRDGTRTRLYASRRLWREMGERLSTGRFRPTVKSGAPRTAAERKKLTAERKRLRRTGTIEKKAPSMTPNAVRLRADSDEVGRGLNEAAGAAVKGRSQ